MAFETGCSQAIRSKDHEPWIRVVRCCWGSRDLTVDRVLIDDAGRRVVHCSTDPQRVKEEVAIVDQPPAWPGQVHRGARSRREHTPTEVGLLSGWCSVIR